MPLSQGFCSVNSSVVIADRVANGAVCRSFIDRKEHHPPPDVPERIIRNFRIDGLYAVNACGVRVVDVAELELFFNEKSFAVRSL